MKKGRKERKPRKETKEGREWMLVGNGVGSHKVVMFAVF